MSDKDLSKLVTATMSTLKRSSRSSQDQQRKPLLAGDRVDHYVVTRPIAGGGMGDVYLAHDQSLGRDVALKVIRRGALGDKRVEAFLREARTTALFSHPNIVVIHEVGNWEGQPFLALEYLDGPTLKEWVDDRAPTLEEALSVMLDVAEALVAAHERGIVHRDLKPANIIIANDGRARVFDFGFAAAFDDEESLAGGTRKYMAPEQHRREPPVPAVDIWSLGLIVRALLGSLHEDSARAGTVTAPLDALLESAGHEDPTKRPRTVAFRDELSRALEQVRIEADLERARRMLGRDEERSRLLDEAMALREGGRGRILGVEGEAGLGKTLLLVDFVRRAQAAGLRVVHGSAEAVLRHTPFHAWRSVLSQLISGRPEMLPGEPSPVSETHGLEPLLPALETVLRMSETEAWSAPLLEIEGRAEVMTRELTKVVALRVSGPLVIVIDDWHWADPASCRLARSVVSKVPQVLLVVCYRPFESVTGEQTTVQGLPRFKSIKLPPLNNRAVGRIVEGRAPSAEPGGELSRLVIRHAAGNPLFAEELTALAQQSQANPLMGETTLQGVLNRRLDALPVEVLDVLTTASVIGRRFQAGVLEKLHDKELVTSALARLLEVGLVTRRKGSLSFWHDLTRVTTYERLQGAERRERHREVARALEEMGGDAARQHSSLAGHWEKAGDKDKTVDHSEKAADQAINAGDHREAIRQLKRCLGLKEKDFEKSRLNPPRRPIRWRRLLAETYYTAPGQLTEASKHAVGVLALADWDMPSSFLGWQLATAGRFAMAMLSSFRRVRPEGTEAGDVKLEFARALGVAATAAWYDGDDEKMHYSALAAFCEARRCGYSQTLVVSASRLGCELSMRGWPLVGGKFERLARDAAKELDDRPAIAYACMMDALYRVGIGYWDRVIDKLDLCQTICGEYHDDSNWCNAQVIRYWVLHYRGRREEATKAAQELYDRAEEAGNDQHRGWGTRSLAVQLLYSGDADGARRLAQESLEILDSARDRLESLQARGALALAWMRLGRHDQAEKEADETLKGLKNAGRPSSHAALEGCSGIVEVYLKAQTEGWSEKTAKGLNDAVTDSLKILDLYRRRFPVGRARYALWKGVAESDNGNRAKAERWWRKGHAIARDLGLSDDEARISRRLEGSG